jgi:HlyD family secretion protein
MEKKFKVLIPVLIILIAAGAYFLLTRKQADPNLIKVSGNIETTTVGVGFKVAGMCSSGRSMKETGSRKGS